MAKKKAVKKVVKKAVKPAAEPEEVKPAAAPAPAKPKKPAAGNVGKEITVKLSSGAEVEGLCVSERKITGGAQVFLKIKGKVSRWFNSEDIVK